MKQHVIDSALCRKCLGWSEAKGVSKSDGNHALGLGNFRFD